MLVLFHRHHTVFANLPLCMHTHYLHFSFLPTLMYVVLCLSYIAFLIPDSWWELQDGEQMCRYRIVQDGLPLLLPHVTKQLLQLTVQEFLHLIEGRSLYVPEEARAASAAVPNGTSADGEVKPEVAQATAEQAAQQAADGDAGEEMQAEEAEQRQASEGTCSMQSLGSCLHAGNFANLSADHSAVITGLSQHVMP